MRKVAHNTYTKMKHDNINHPSHYCNHPSGVQAIVISEKLGFCLGNSFKYLMRCTYKGNCLDDLKKAEWYLNRHLASTKRRWWHWFFDEDYSSRIFGNTAIRQILQYESRYCGHMAAALDAIYEAGFVHGSPDVVKRAIRSVEKMIRIEESKLL